ncbi:MAG: hypothetical protein JO212_10210, partial [Acetobacteraceae bacterium]|nr:hypothetical protein [Acetobacteraceae bacterium]
QFPYFSAKFNAVAPESTYDCSPPFLTALAEPGAVQIWSGLIARTAPDWSLLIRPPANLPGGAGYALYEGIVEADNWFGPLFTNVRLTRTNQPVRFKADYPLVQAQPLPRALYSEEMLGAMEIVPGLAGLSEREWDDYFTAVVAPNADPNRPHGRYAVAARKRRPASCPFAVKSLSTSSEGFAGRA